MRTAATIGQKLAQGLEQAVEVGNCLEWHGPFACRGVTPVVKVRNHEKQRTDNHSVPRQLWEAAYGPIPEGKLVYRSCCNNACVLLWCLTIGARKDWARARKKAGVTGHHHTTKLHLTMAARRRADVTNSMEKAREVRLLAAERVKTDEISQRTGVHPTMVAEIRQGRAWRELGGGVFAGLGA
jgi:hypothetical protein